MSNKFMKSVLERSEQETTKILPLEENNIEPILTGINKEDKSKLPFIDLSSYLVSEKLRSAKNKTFYLDQDVIKILHERAVNLNITDSKLCNDILRSVLGL